MSSNLDVTAVRLVRGFPPKISKGSLFVEWWALAVFALEEEQEFRFKILCLIDVACNHEGDFHGHSGDKPRPHLKVRRLQPPWMKVLTNPTAQPVAIRGLAYVRDVGSTTTPRLRYWKPHRVHARLGWKLAQENPFRHKRERVPRTEVPILQIV